jgi:hypothetical protein
VFREQRLRVSHGVDDQFFVGHADESGDIHARFLRAGSAWRRDGTEFNRGKMDWFRRTSLTRKRSLWR